MVSTNTEPTATDIAVSAARLRRAADHLVKLATTATGGPWLLEHDVFGVTPQALYVLSDDHPDSYDGTLGVGGFDRPADNEWAAALSPHIANPLVAWLRTAAEDAEQIGPDPYAVATADAILRETI